jgi:hypothetical protein
MPELKLEELSVRRAVGVWTDELEAGACDPSALRGCNNTICVKYANGYAVAATHLE